jgi:hypothetical protein
MPLERIADLFLAEISGFAERLQREHPLMHAALEGRVTPHAVASYLAGVRCLLEHTPIHLEIAASVARQHGLVELVEYFKHKQYEEEGHARWADSDLVELEREFGVGGACVPPSILHMVAFIEDLVRNHPCHYLGYILFAEHATVQAGPTWVKALGDHCGIPASALSSIAKHVELDQFHVAEGRDEINHLLRHVIEPGPFVDALRGAMSHFEAFCDELHLSVEQKPALRGAARPLWQALV